MKMLIGSFIFRCSGVQRSVANKESKSFPPTQHSDFQARATLMSDSECVCECFFFLFVVV